MQLIGFAPLSAGEARLVAFSVEGMRSNRKEPTKASAGEEIEKDVLGKRNRRDAKQVVNKMNKRRRLRMTREKKSQANERATLRNIEREIETSQDRSVPRSGETVRSDIEQHWRIALQGMKYREKGGSPEEPLGAGKSLQYVASHYEGLGPAEKAEMRQRLQRDIKAEGLTIFTVKDSRGKLAVTVDE